MEQPKYFSRRENSKVQAFLANSLSNERVVNAILSGNSELHVSRPGEAKRIDIWTESVFYQFFNEFKLVYRQKFKDGLVEIIGDEATAQFLQAVSLWGDGKSKRVKDPLVLGLKRSVMNAVRMTTAEAAALQKTTPKAAPSEPMEDLDYETDAQAADEDFELKSDEVLAILELNQKLLTESISDCNTWLQKISAEPISINEVLFYRGMTFREPTFTQERENYEPLENITSFSLSQTAAEQFATMRDPTKERSISQPADEQRAPDKGQSVILCAFLNDISDRILFFSPFVDMPTLQFEVGVVPFQTQHYCHSLGYENYTSKDGKNLKVDFYVLDHRSTVDEPEY